MANGYGRSNDGFGISRQESVALIVRTAVDNGVIDPRQIAYMLATAQHETRNFTAPDEDFGRQQAKKLGYGGGEEYFGRGYVHLTHIDNYQKFDRLLGLNGQLVSNPALAKEPEIAAKILVIGMRDGLFTGKPLSRYINDDSHDTYNARRVVNGVNPKQPWSVKAARDCATHAQQWEKFLTPERMAQLKTEHISSDRADTQTVSKDSVRQWQSALNQLGYKGADGKPLAVDGIVGPQTKSAIEAFQKDHGLAVDGVVGPQTLKALEEAKAKQQATSESKKADVSVEQTSSADKAQRAAAAQKEPVAAKEQASASPVRSDARLVQLGEQILQRLDDIYLAVSTQKPQFNVQQNLNVAAYWLGRAVKEQFPLSQPCSCVRFETRNNKELMHTFFNQGGVQATVTADINKGANTPLEHSLAALVQQNAENQAQEHALAQQQRSTPVA